MKRTPQTPREIPDFIRKRCPHLDEAGLVAATERMQKYLEIALRVFERTEAGKQLAAESALTEDEGADRMENARTQCDESL